jgi:hypothetical protein
MPVADREVAARVGWSLDPIPDRPCLRCKQTRLPTSEHQHLQLSTRPYFARILFPLTHVILTSSTSSHLSVMDHFPDTPRTSASDTRYSHLTFVGPDQSIEPSFASPAKDRNDLLRQMQALNTPRASRNPLANLRNPPAKNEFTPLLKSATKNARLTRGSATPGAGRMGTYSGSSSRRQSGKLNTPAGLKDGYGMDSPALPEASSMFDQPDSSEYTGDNTPAPPAQSSSAVSTPMAILPGRGGDGPLDRGNMLTLREQEAVSTLWKS